jgi:hypothetical protein
MKDEYQALDESLRNVEFKFRDYLDDGHSSEADSILRAIHQLAEEAEVQKNPRSIEDGIKRAIEQLREAASASDPFMDYRHLNDLRDQLEEAQAELRKFSNY